MMDFEDQLRNALSRKEPPVGFAGRVLSRTKPRNYRKPWAAGLIAASLLAGAWGVKRHEDEGQAARTQLLQALRITGSKLERIHRKVESN